MELSGRKLRRVGSGSQTRREAAAEPLSPEETAVLTAALLENDLLILALLGDPRWISDSQPTANPAIVQDAPSTVSPTVSPETAGREPGKEAEMNDETKTTLTALCLHCGSRRPYAPGDRCSCTPPPSYAELRARVAALEAEQARVTLSSSPRRSIHRAR